VRKAAALALLAAAIARSSSVVVAQSAAPTLTPFRGLIDHVTTTIWGGVASGSSEGNVHSISGDGRYVVFSSGAPDLVPNDYNGLDDAFLRDRMTTRQRPGQRRRCGRHHPGHGDQHQRPSCGIRLRREQPRRR
jgi:hypothetical protein